MCRAWDGRQVGRARQGLGMCSMGGMLGGSRAGWRLAAARGRGQCGWMWRVCGSAGGDAWMVLRGRGACAPDARGAQGGGWTGDGGGGRADGRAQGGRQRGTARWFKRDAPHCLAPSTPGCTHDDDGTRPDARLRRSRPP